MKQLKLVPALCGCLIAAATVAQTPATPWFGLPAPGPVTGLPVDFSRLDLPRIPAPSARVAADLTSEKLMGYLRDYVKFSYASRDAGDRLWGRMAGSPQTAAAVAYVAQALRSAGLTVSEQSVPFTRYNHPLDWSVHLLGDPTSGPASSPVELASAFPMPVAGATPTPADQGEIDASGTKSVSGPLVFAGDGSATSLSMVNATGKIAVVVIEPAPTAFYSETVRQASQLLAKAGAVGLLAIYNMPGNMQLMLGGCPAKLLCFTLGGEDGSFLRSVIERAAAAGTLERLRVELRITRQAATQLQARVLMATIPGREKGENIVVSAHSDAYFEGANDNASGVAALIALARHYAHGRKPRHDLVFFLSPGHHSATNGTAALMNFDPELPKRNLVLLNLEHIGQAGVYRSYMKSTTDRYGRRSAAYVPTNWDSQGREVTLSPDSAALRSAWNDAAARNAFTTPAVINGPAIAEPAPFVAAGGTGVQNVETSVWFHTTGDTVAAIAPEAMQRAALFYRDFIDNVDKLSRSQIRPIEVGPATTGR